MEDLDIFATVVEQESLNKASALLNLSQPALSRKIMKLEEELGVQLFERRGKRLALTRAGELCYEHALEFRSLTRKFQQALREFTKVGKITTLTVGASLTTLQSTLPELITAYTARYPATDLKALTGKTHEIVTLVKERKVDLGVVASSIAVPGLKCEPLFDDHLCLVLPHGHPYLDKQELQVTDLNDLSMILFSKGTWYRVLTDELFHRFAIFPDVKMEIDSFEAIIRLVATCRTATLLPNSYLGDRLIGLNELQVRDIPELKQTTRTTSLIYSDDAAVSEAAREFVEVAKRQYRRGQDE
ncbi:LysR family transcriptional regulator [Gordoniibacillus kamchatkensis]|uniref:LysR family transcriptional regulator n=1 Tax=Gordoniibacillus kamchatkensis TaxID=1590651 RepID=A0ABR5AJS3_9BACL|nr:LysR family transcriptional regulator [Paenibacillus sp. VKM B-2647]KIL41226.1 LysR family transcriptional regulator [Paenibacillus sp. VKM B-2647]